MVYLDNKVQLLLYALTVFDSYAFQIECVRGADSWDVILSLARDVINTNFLFCFSGALSAYEVVKGCFVVAWVKSLCVEKPLQFLDVKFGFYSILKKPASKTTRFFRCHGRQRSHQVARNTASIALVSLQLVRCFHTMSLLGQVAPPVGAMSWRLR